MGDGWWPYWAWFSGSSVHFQIWKVRLCCMKNINKMARKSQKKIGMVVITGDGWVPFQGPVHTSKYRKKCFSGWKMAIKYRKNEKKSGMDWWWCWEGAVFRVQCAFPNMETFASFYDRPLAINMRGQDSLLMWKPPCAWCQKAEYVVKAICEVMSILQPYPQEPITFLGDRTAAINMKA